MQHVTIVDYGSGNLKSLHNAMTHLGVQTHWANTPRDILAADRILFPGVGAFGYACEQLNSLHLREALLEFTNSGKSFFGICLGMQLLFNSSAEDEHQQKGLGIFKGRVEAFIADKVPHMGWNEVRAENHDCFQSSSSPFAYFIHSYFCRPEAQDVIAATTEYAGEFCCAVAKDNVFATQFHPEKSGDYGLSILKNWLAL